MQLLQVVLQGWRSRVTHKNRRLQTLHHGTSQHNTSYLSTSAARRLSFSTIDSPVVSYTPTIDTSFAHAHHAHTTCESPTESISSNAQIKVLLLEIAVSIHSVFVGVALGVADSKRFGQMLAAIALYLPFSNTRSSHQFFEGIALGTTLVNAGLDRRKIWILSLVFAVTTPIGILVGILIKNSLEGDSSSAFYAQGMRARILIARLF